MGAQEGVLRDNVGRKPTRRVTARIARTFVLVRVAVRERVCRRGARARAHEGEGSSGKILTHQRVRLCTVGHTASLEARDCTSPIPRVRVRTLVAVADGSGTRVLVPVREAATVREAVAAAVPEAVAVGATVPEDELVALTLGLLVSVSDALGVPVSVADALGVPVEDADDEPVSEPDADTDAVVVAVADTEPVSVADGEGVPVRVPVTLPVPVRDGVRVPDALGVPVPVGDAEPVSDEVPDAEAVLEGVAVADGVLEGVGELESRTAHRSPVGMTVQSTKKEKRYTHVEGSVGAARYVELLAEQKKLTVARRGAPPMAAHTAPPSYSWLTMRAPKGHVGSALSLKAT